METKDTITISTQDYEDLIQLVERIKRQVENSQRTELDVFIDNERLKYKGQKISIVELLYNYNTWAYGQGHKTLRYDQLLQKVITNYELKIEDNSYYLMGASI
jgi:hypothetical protein